MSHGIIIPISDVAIVADLGGISVNIPTKSDLNELISFKEPYCITIYVSNKDPEPAHRADLIALKNSLRSAEKQLINQKAPPSLIKKILAPPRALLSREDLPKQQNLSIAIFAKEKYFKYFTIPGKPFDDSTIVSDRFNIEQLKKVADNNWKYYVLALSQSTTTLYRGDKYSIKEVPDTYLAQGMEKLLGIDEYKQSRQTHAIAPASSGKGSEGSHQQYNPRQTNKKMLTEYFRRINKHINSIFHQQVTAPLIIAGTGSVLSSYRAVNTCKHLVPVAIIGNIERSRTDDIRIRAVNIIDYIEQ